MNYLAIREAFTVRLAGSDDGGPNTLELYNQAASLVSAGAWSCDLSNGQLAWTDGVFNLFGLSSGRAPERYQIVEMYGHEARELLERKRAYAIETCSGFSHDANIVRPDGTERWIRINAATRSSNGRAQRLYGMKQDVTEDRARWDALRAHAECDPLTGVANRAPFQRFLEQRNDELALDCVGAMALFDMDGFKQINDWWGHAAGDACLAAFGQRLRIAFPQSRLVSRIGGDEFAVLLPKVCSRKQTQVALRGLIGNLVAPVLWNGDLLPLGVSVGLAFASEETNFDRQELFVAADRALYNAKESASSVLVCA